MAVPRINIKNIDYFKFKKLVIDGVRDDYNSCTKEVKSLCDCVQTLNFRDEEFDDVSDRARFSEICSYYRQILSSKRIEATDMRIKSGWWGDHKNAYSAGKIKPAILKDLLLKKSKEWTERHGGLLEKLSDSEIQNKIEGRGLYVLKHKDHQCFQYVGKADKVFARFAEKLKAAFEGSIQEPLAALLVISMATDWDFYFIPVSNDDDERVLRILENDLILKHDSIWPHGLNFRLHIDSIVEVSEFRKSCLRHRWPPESESVEGDFLDLSKLREQIATLAPSPVIDPTPPPTPKGKKTTKAKANILPPPSPPPFCFGDVEMDVSPLEPEEDEDGERPGSGMSNATYVVSNVRQSPTFSESTLVKTPPPIRKPIPIRATPRPTSAGKRGGATPRPGERPQSGKTPPRPTSARDRPTTPRRAKQTPRRPLSGSPEPSYEPRWDDEDPGSVSQDESSGSMDRSHSMTSLSSTDGRHPVSPEHVTASRKSPAPHGNKPLARPTTLFKSKQDRSRLPMATPRRSTKN